MLVRTSQLCSAYPERVKVLRPVLHSFGGKKKFCGKIRTLKTFENSHLVNKALDVGGKGYVLVVDGGGLKTVSLFGSDMASLALGNGWEGVVIHGCVRDTEDLSKIPIGIFALDKHPLMKTPAKEVGEKDIPVSLGGVTLHPNHYIYCDPDGIVTGVDFLG